MKKGKKHSEFNEEISVTPIYDDPVSVYEMVNKYGTYNIQPTADTGKDYPKIAQGLPKKEKEHHKTEWGEK